MKELLKIIFMSYLQFLIAKTSTLQVPTNALMLECKWTALFCLERPLEEITEKEAKQGSYKLQRFPDKKTVILQ